MSEEMILLDHVDGIEVPAQKMRQPTNEFYALICQKRGLDLLQREVAGAEATLRTVIPNGMAIFMGLWSREREVVDGLHRALDSIPHETLMTCFFQWYSVSACQFVRTVGTIAYRADSTRPTPLQYVESVLGSVKVYRDKVGAHYADTLESRFDNDAERKVSVFPEISWSRDQRFVVGGKELSLRRGDQPEQTSSSIQPWSLTTEHAKLIARYWPASK